MHISSAAEPPATTFPTPDTVQGVHDERDTQYAIEAYRFFYPSVSAEAMYRGNRELGIADSGAIGLLDCKPHHVVFTANSDTPYASAVLDLRLSGPMVIDLPAGPYVGLINDHHQRWVVDMGLPGPDEGKGGKYLVLPPDYSGEVPLGTHAQRSGTYKVILALRAIPLDGDKVGALAALRKVRVYPLARSSGVLPYVDITDRPLDSTPLRWEESLEYWRQLHAIITAEPVPDEFRPMYGLLAALGIESSRPFAPDARMQGILERAAKTGLEQMRVDGFASERPERMVWSDRRWEWVGLIADDPNFETRDYLDLQARDRWFFQAIGASPAMFRRKAGSGSVYFLGVRDQDGAYLEGASTYKLAIPHPVPAKLFWSVTAYDALTRSQVQTAQESAVIGSLQHGSFPVNEGALELYFGPKAPPGKEREWIQTAPGSHYFLYFRIYGPAAESLDGSWRLGDLVKLNATNGKPARNPPVSAQTLRSISTPERVDTRAGELMFRDGVPSEDTIDRVFDALDHMHAIEAFLNSFQAVSLAAMRRGLHSVGVRDHDILIFSGLMDSRSLFLTANCDTLYFFGFLDLSRGPVVIEIPPQVLGVLDDMWFHWLSDFGMAGPDRGEGGKYLVVPLHYDGPLPEGGFFACEALTDHALVLGRAFLENDDPAPAVARIKRDLKIYPYVPGAQGTSVAAYLSKETSLAPLSEAPPMRFVEGTGLELNTIPPNDLSYYELLHWVVQTEPVEALNPELAGQFAALGIRKGRPFAPDTRMKKILEDAALLANATARTLGLRARSAEGFHYYEESSAWINPLFVGGSDFLRPPPLVSGKGVELYPYPGARTLNARTGFFYIATGITPAMCMRITHMGSQYLGANLDSKGKPFDGGKTYKLMLPPEIPAAAFWSLTLYDNQTRSMLQTEQRFPRAGSQAYPTPAASQSADGSTLIYIGPSAPRGTPPGNWIQTVPGKGWFIGLRLYSPLQAFFDKTWRPSEIMEV